jgi:prepilin-type N-terminal cleavage/methylation domain-containing protein
MNMKGFTLIELIVVISVIAVLAGMVVPIVGDVLDDAKEVKGANEVRTLGVACIQYEKDYGYQLHQAKHKTYGYYANVKNQKQANWMLHRDRLGRYVSANMRQDPWATPYRLWWYQAHNKWIKGVTVSLGSNKANGPTPYEWNYKNTWRNKQTCPNGYYFVFK